MDYVRSNVAHNSYEDCKNVNFATYVAVIFRLKLFKLWKHHH